MINEFADIHVHPSLKPFNNRKYPEGQGKTTWDKFDERKSDLDKLLRKIRNQVTEVAKSSQANLDSCVEARLNRVFLALYPTERQWFDARPKNIIYDLVLKRKYHHLGAALSGFPTEFVRKIMTRIREGEGVDYFNEELLPLLYYTLDQQNSKSKNYPYYSFKIATEYDDINTEPNIIWGILTIEGSNSLGNYQSHSTFYKEYNDLTFNEKKNLKDDFTDNIKTLKSWNNGKYTPFFISFCHHFNNLLAGHSRSLSAFRDLLDQEPGINKGFNELGTEIIELLLSRENGRRILIDTKHMSIQTRKEYHEIVEQYRDRGDNIPIIHSHGAINGWESFDQAADFPDEDSADKYSYFSKFQINLNDEEIRNIYESDGIIGIEFHESRMPGGLVKKKTRKDRNIYNKLHKKKYLSTRQRQDFINTKTNLKQIYVKIIWSNIFHIINHIYNHYQEDGWKIIAAGSDYDGMVDPFNGYFSVRQLPALFNDMVEYLDDFINNGQGSICHAVVSVEDGKPVIKTRDFNRQEITQLMFDKTSHEIVRDICFNNVDRFLSEYFNPGYLSQ